VSGWADALGVGGRRTARTARSDSLRRGARSISSGLSHGLADASYGLRVQFVKAQIKDRGQAGNREEGRRRDPTTFKAPNRVDGHQRLACEVRSRTPSLLTPGSDERTKPSPVLPIVSRGRLASHVANNTCILIASHHKVQHTCRLGADVVFRGLRGRLHSAEDEIKQCHPASIRCLPVVMMSCDPRRFPRRRGSISWPAAWVACRRGESAYESSCTTRVTYAKAANAATTSMSSQTRSRSGSRRPPSRRVGAGPR
jgi:hypothetical protein